MSSSTVLPPDFYFIESFHLLVCSRHQIAVPARQIKQHLREHFMSHEIENHQYKTICFSLPIGSIHESHVLIRAMEPIKSIPGLGVPRNGYICEATSCTYITISLDHIKRHLRERHGKTSLSQQQPWIGLSSIQALIKNQFLFRVISTQVSSFSLFLVGVHTNIYIYRIPLPQPLNQLEILL